MAGISLTYGNSVITMVPDIANNIVRTQQNNGVVSYLTDNKTLYQYSLTYMGYKEDIIVPDYTGQTEYSFTYYTNGLHMDVLDGELVVKDTDGNIIAGFSEVIVFTADDLNNTFGEYRCETIEKNEEYRVTIVLDAEYLADERTAYPIVIDPSLEVNADMGTSAIEDATINSTAGTSPNGTSIFVGKRSTKGIARMLVRFPGLDLSTFSSASNIISAKYILRDLMCYSTHLPVEAHVFKSAWSESNVTWTSTNPDNYVSATLDTQTVFYRNGNYISAGSSYSNSYAFDITNAVRGWKSGTYNPAAGFILKTTSAIETGSENISVCFASFERSSNKPRLIIDYTDPPPASITHTSITIAEGFSFQLGITSTNAVSVSWLSMTPSVATVSSTGLVTGVSPGTSIVCATVTIPNATTTYYYCTVSVTGDGVAHYFSNRNFGKYLHKSGSTFVDAQSGLLSSLGNTIQWKLTSVNGSQYTIQPVSDLSLYLYAAGTSVWLSSTPTLNTNLLWTTPSAANGGVLIQNVATQAYLTLSSNGTLSLISSTGSAGSSTYDSCVWGMVDTDFYGNTSDATMRELSNGFSIADMEIEEGDASTPTINKYPSNALWSNVRDFNFAITDAAGYGGDVYINSTTGSITGWVAGDVLITATHKVTGRTFAFTVKVIPLLEKEADYTLPANTQEQLRIIRTSISQVQASDMSYADQESTLDYLELQEDLIRADYILTGSNYLSAYANAVIPNFETVLNSSLATVSEDLYRVVVNRMLVLFGHKYAESSRNPLGFFLDYDCMYDEWTEESAYALDWYYAATDDSNDFFNRARSGITPLEREDTIIGALQLFRYHHEAVKNFVAINLGAYTEVTIKGVGDVPEDSEWHDRIRGRADIAKESVGTAFWEVKPNKPMYYGGGLGTIQLQWYVTAASAGTAKRGGHEFGGPFTAGYPITTFKLEIPKFLKPNETTVLRVSSSPYYETVPYDSGLILYEEVENPDDPDDDTPTYDSKQTQLNLIMENVKVATPITSQYGVEDLLVTIGVAVVAGVAIGFCFIYAPEIAATISAFLSGAGTSGTLAAVQQALASGTVQMVPLCGYTVGALSS